MSSRIKRARPLLRGQGILTISSAGVIEGKTGVVAEKVGLQEFHRLHHDEHIYQLAARGPSSTSS
jgi:hypothetical protein